MSKKLIALALAVVLCISIFAGCTQSVETPAAEPAEAETEAEPEVAAEPVVLTVVGGWPDCRAIDELGAAFTAEYPNCTVVYEYLQGEYYPSLVKRMTGDAPIDLCFTTSIQSDVEDTAPLVDYALDLNGEGGPDLSQTFPGLIDNFIFREESGENTKLYSVPLGAEMRGLYVNVTLLDSLDLAVPTNQAELLNACQVLTDNGYVAFGGNPGSFSQWLVYPWICNIIANADDPQAAYARVDACEPGLSEMFVEPYSFIYTLVENGYYDYKTVQNDRNMFNETTDDDFARAFLNIAANGDTFEKVDDIGQVAFMPWTMSSQRTMEKTKEDYHSEIQYVFIPAPVGPDGGYVYLSPAHGIAANKGSVNVDWAVKFLDFLFKPENNKLFASTFNIIPNTSDATAYITDSYGVPAERTCELGQVTFRYGFYGMMLDSLINVSKANNPKYMQGYVDGGANTDLTLYPLEYYINQLEDAIAAQ